MAGGCTSACRVQGLTLKEGGVGGGEGKDSMTPQFSAWWCSGRRVEARCTN